MRNFVLNKRTYFAIPVDFNFNVALEEKGLSLSDIRKKPMSVLRLYISLCADISEEEAGNEIQQHILSGGKLDKALEVFAQEVDESDFFRKIQEISATETTETQSEEPNEK